MDAFSLDRPTADVAIVGYGPVGELLANLLGQAGHSVLVLERETAAYPLPRATQFDGEVMRVFQEVGLAEAIAPLTMQTPGMKFVDPNGNVLLQWPRPMEVGPAGWFASYRFHQPALDAVLRQGVVRWPNVQVRTGVTVRAVEQTDDAVSLLYDDLTTAEPHGAVARYAIGCDGARSAVRSSIGSNLIDLGFHEQWLVADCVLKRERPDLGDHSVQFCDPARPATYVRGTGSRRRWELAVLPGEDPACLARPEAVWRLLARWVTPQDAELERATVYTFRSALADQWRSGRVLIAGDAAHQSPPFLGQGLCAGLRDAANLAWKLTAVLHGGAPPHLLDTYESERMPHVREYVEFAVRLGGLINATAQETALAGMEASAGGPARMATLKPRLGPGLSFGSGALIGTQAPQPVLPDGTRFDDVVGRGFRLVLGRAAGPVDAASWQRSGVVVVQAGEPILDEWLAQAGVAAALVRPDHYVMSDAGSDTEIDAMLNLLPWRPKVA